MGGLSASLPLPDYGRVVRQPVIEAISEDTPSLNVRQARLPQSLCQTLDRM
jgi:hypothetical protein